MEHLENFGWTAVEAISSALAVLITMVVLISKSNTRMAKLELKIDTIWEFLIKRAMSEAVVKKLGTFNSPFVINDQTRPYFDFIKKELQEFYRKEGYKMDDKQLFIEIETRFGPSLVNQICIPYNLVAGGCVIGAIAIAKEALPQISDKEEGK